jgi:HlyD family type I secretion membrane fusion protein
MTGLIDGDGSMQPQKGDRDRRSPRSVQQPFPLGPMVMGVLVIIAFLGCLSLWSALAPIESAVISPGVVSVSSYRKTIQHLEGGIIDEILISDGERVQVGQLLVKLRDIQSIAKVKQLRVQYAEARATVERLIAERDGASEVVVPQELQSLGGIDPEIERAFGDQKDILSARRERFADKQAVLEQTLAQSQALIIGLKGQIESTERRLSLANREFLEIQPLVKKSLVPAPRLRELQGTIAEFEGLLSEYAGDVAREEKAILEARLEISELETSAIASVTEQLRTERARTDELTQQVIAAEDVVARTEIRSPIEGVVVNLQVHTREGVVSAGQPLMEIVPVGDDLVIEAFVDPADIDEVRVGLPAHVHLTAQNRRRRQLLEGSVSAVSADRLVDEQMGTAYYRARIELDPSSLDEHGQTLLAGMGADVFIRTGARTPFDYLIQPIIRTINLGLRES